MIHAELNGKISVEEDVLTSTAIGLLSLLPDEYLISFLGRAISLQKQEERLLENQIRNFTRLKSIEFWKTGFTGGIPDIFVKLEDEQCCSSFVLIIEVKHHADKSGSAEIEDGEIKNKEDDQLNRYWNSLVQHYPRSKKAMVFLTGHRVMPHEDLQVSWEASGRKAQLYWLSWYSLYSFILDLLHVEKHLKGSSEHKILQLLEVYLRFKGYVMFSGWPQLAVVENWPGAHLFWYHKACALSSRLPAFYQPAYQRTYIGQVVSWIGSDMAVFYRN